MKKLSMICMAALLVMAMSCKKNEEGTNADGKGFRASMEAQTGDSKTHLENDGIVKWDSGDAIRVVNGVTPAACFDFTTDAVVKDGCVEFKPSSQGVDDSFFQSSYTAYYPAGIYNHETGKVTLPATQTYAKVNSYDSFGNGCNPMIAKSKTEQLSFKHLCGILALQLKGTCTVASIKLSALDETVKLWGEGTVTYNDNDEPVLTLDGNTRAGANSITLNCGTDGVTLNGTTATKFYFVIPAGVDLGGISVELTDKAGNVWNNSTPAMTMLIARSKVASMAEIAVETHNPNFPIGAIPGRFTINANGDQVCFSRGNLQYQASTGIWRFAEHQYDFVGAQDLFNQNKKVGNVFENGVQCDNRFTSDAYSGWIDLFGWGTSGYDDKFPYMTSTTNTDYGDGDNNISGTEYDWGKHNAISNGGNTPNTWRTLTCLGNDKEEWYYLIYKRGTNSSALWAKGRITSEHSATWAYDMEKDIAGFILLPDGWVKPDGVNFTAGQGRGYLTNSYSPEQWAVMEAAGAVFLPDAGHRYNSTGSYANVYYGDGAGYWTSTKYPNSTGNATIFTFGDDGAMHSYNGLSRSNGFSVRLVQDLPKQTP